MAAVPPQTGSAQLPSTPNDASMAPQEPLNWDGDRMFNIYIYDYCFKRGFRKTARELMHEAEIPPNSQPPIDAKQGLLFEWWSVFWVLFQAKSTNMPTDNNNAILYNQHQQLSHVRAMRAHEGLQPIPGMMENERASAAVMNRLPGSSSPATQGGPRGPGQHPNGIPHPSLASGPPEQLQNSQQHPFNGIPPGQRPMSMNGPQQPQLPNGQPPRPMGTPNHTLPFQSPTMAHSPNVRQQGPPPPNQQTPGPQGPPMGNLSGPSPVMGRGQMMPPNGVPPGMVMGGTPQQPQQGNMSAGSPGPSHGQMTGGLSSVQMVATSPQLQSQQAWPPGSAMNHPQPMPAQGTPEYNIEVELRKIPYNWTTQLRVDCGIERNLAQFTLEDKKKIIEMWKGPQYKSGAALSATATRKQMQHMQQMQHQQQQQQQRAMKRNSSSPGEQPEGPSDASPPDRKRQRRSPMDNSMAPKASPGSYPSTPQQMAAIPPPNQMQGRPQGIPGHMQQQPPPGAGPHMMMRTNMGGPPGQMPMNGQIPPPNMAGQNQQRPPQGQPMMGSMQQMGPQGQMGPPPLGMSLGQMGGNYQVPLHQVHNAVMQQGGQPNAGSPAGPDQGSFNPGGPQGGRSGPGQQSPFGGQKVPSGRPGSMVPPPPGAAGASGSMMPPPSPSQNASGLNNKDGNMHSPRGPPGQPPNQQGGPSQQQQQQGGPQQSQNPQHPGTPGPHQQGGPQQQGGQQGSGGPGGPMGMTQSPAGSLMGGSMGGMMGDQMMFGSADFGLSDFDPSAFGNDSGMSGAIGMDFEREFGLFFNPNDGLESLSEMK